MDSSSLRKTPNYNYDTKRDREKFYSRVISPAISGQKCPICLETLSDRRAAVLVICTHAYCLECIRKWSDLKRKCPLCNAEFDSWFYKINISSRKFLRQQLPAPTKGKSVINESHHSSRASRRTIQRSRDEFNGAERRTRPLPWRRSFGLGRPGSSVPSHIAIERKLEWRASVYNRRLQAVPLSPRDFLEQNVSRNNFQKERILQRIEPWIQRELQAILEDPDPSIIVHVVSTLFIASIEAKFVAPPRQLGVEDDFLAPLRPFLHNQTDMFWHELRCFAESSLTMETYDAVVDYRQLG
ncbi:hypothetical protein Dsin_029344 [Dipteronia sinensis]|uniref:RING-type E3 ubiquitin transferase n=1 Tax=Dipteronia sinensis TaxID=43782 RepID=A0AAD9ZSE8_9ROSI|nr:hypothetical protein Dsin_029344 [Dipteronia sinensis]